MANKKKAESALDDPPRLESLRVQNFRALRDVHLTKLTPLTVLLGPNGSGKSTIFDVFNFLAECFQHGLRHAWDRRGRAKELRSRGASGPIEIELKYRERRRAPIITYHLAIDEGPRGPHVVDEWLQWTRGRVGRPFKFLAYKNGQGYAVKGENPESDVGRTDQPLRSPDLLAVNTLGALSDYPPIAALREFISDWYVSYLSVEHTRSQPEAGPQERLTKTGDNLANVVQFLKEQHSDVLNHIFTLLAKRVPRLEKVVADAMADGRLLLQIKDAPFSEPVLARFASDGTLKMLAYLVVLNDPTPPQFIGIEEPENFLHPRLLPELAEECRTASERSQLLVTTHSPFFLNEIRAEEMRALYRDDKGFTRVVRASDMTGIPEFMDAGAKLGELWLEGHFPVGDPLRNAGAPVKNASKQ